MVLLAAPIDPPNRYAAAADLIRVEELARHTIAARVRLGLTATAQAKQIGISHSTLTSVEAGSTPSYATVTLLLRWLSRN